MLNPYYVLGLSDQASKQDIKYAYYQLAQRLHPDTNPNNEAAQLQFAQVNQAYRKLSDDEARGVRTTYFESPGIDVNVALSHRTVQSMLEPQIMYLIAEIGMQHTKVDTSQRRKPIFVTLILDQSNSMLRQNRMQRVQSAAIQIIDYLEPDDKIAVVAFNDWAKTIVQPSLLTEKAAIKSQLHFLSPSGGTEMFKGLELAHELNNKERSREFIHHYVLITDGQTYGDQVECLELAQGLFNESTTLSAFGIGDEWNDNFLDQLCSITGGFTSFVRNVDDISTILMQHLVHIARSTVEKLNLNLACDAGIAKEVIFRLQPDPQPMLEYAGRIPLGVLNPGNPIRLLIQLQLPPDLKPGFLNVARLVTQGDVPTGKATMGYHVSDITVEVTREYVADETPEDIISALNKYTLYHMQERARNAIETGDIEQGTLRLNNLATRLYEIGEVDLAQQAMDQAKHVKLTNELSMERSKNIRYGTRSLFSSKQMTESLANLFESGQEIRSKVESTRRAADGKINAPMTVNIADDETLHNRNQHTIDISEYNQDS